MLGCVDPTGAAASDAVAGGDRAPGSLAGAIDVRDFRDAALGVIANVIARGNTPVLVGGSDYYLRAVVSESLLDEGEDARAVESSDEDQDDADAATKKTKLDRTKGEPTVGPTIRGTKRRRSRLTRGSARSTQSPPPRSTRETRAGSGGTSRYATRRVNRRARYSRGDDAPPPTR